MARPIQKRWFGPGLQIRVNAVMWADGSISGNAYIVKQTGSTAYIVSNGTTKTERVFMVDATPGLQPGQCAISATPFGGSVLWCKKIAQFRLSVYAPDGSPDSYSWSTIPANAVGQADLNLI
jgi:hypothetical protein